MLQSKKNFQFPSGYCEECEATQLNQFLSCEKRNIGSCPYVEQKVKNSASCAGVFIILFAIILLLAFSILPFSLFAKQKQSVGVYGMLIGTLFLTFAYTIISLFILLGIVWSGLKRSLFYSKSTGRYVEVYRLLSIPLSYRIVEMGDTIEYSSSPSLIPLSLAGFLIEDSLFFFKKQKRKQNQEEQGLLEKLEKINLTLDQSLINAFIGALGHLLMHSFVTIKKAKQQVFTKWYSTELLDLYYIFKNDSHIEKNIGLLEKDLLNKISNWQQYEEASEEKIAATLEDLVKTCKNTDGDFSHYQVRQLILKDGETHGVFQKTGRGFIGKLMPKIEPVLEMKEEVEKAKLHLVEFFEWLFENEEKFGQDILFSLNKVVMGSPDFNQTRSPLDQLNAMVRKKIMLYVVGISFLLSFIMCTFAFMF